MLELPGAPNFSIFLEQLYKESHNATPASSMKQERLKIVPEEDGLLINVPYDIRIGDYLIGVYNVDISSDYNGVTGLPIYLGERTYVGELVGHIPQEIINTGSTRFRKLDEASVAIYLEIEQRLLRGMSWKQPVHLYHLTEIDRESETYMTSFMKSIERMFKSGISISEEEYVTGLIDDMFKAAISRHLFIRNCQDIPFP